MPRLPETPIDPAAGTTRADRHSRFAAMAPAYVVHALAADDVPAFEAHLISCTTCPAEVGRLRDMALVLAQAVAATGKSPVNEIVVRQAAETSTWLKKLRRKA